MVQKLCLLFIVLAISILNTIVPTTAGSQTGTSSVTITKYAYDGTTVLSEVTKTVAELESELSVRGDGATHYWMQGPTFEPGNLWDPSETLNLKDKGMVQGSTIKDLCDLVGGASTGDQIEIKSIDNLAHTYEYQSIYTPDPAMGPMVLCWKKNSAYAGDGFVEGMQMAFFAPTANGSGIYVFGNQDMRDYLPEGNWHYFFNNGVLYPSCNGLSTKWVNEINVYTSGTSSSQASASLNATANIILPIVGIELDTNTVDYGDLMPGQNSGTQTVVVSNTGTVGCNVTLEIQGDDSTVQSFYEQSLFVNGTHYDINNLVTSIVVAGSQSVDTQLRLPSSWDQGGEQKATFIFWAEAQ